MSPNVCPGVTWFFILWITVFLHHSKILPWITDILFFFFLTNQGGFLIDKSKKLILPHFCPTLIKDRDTVVTFQGINYNERNVKCKNTDWLENCESKLTHILNEMQQNLQSSHLLFTVWYDEISLYHEGKLKCQSSRKVQKIVEIVIQKNAIMILFIVPGENLNSVLLFLFDFFVSANWGFSNSQLFLR